MKFTNTKTQVKEVGTNAVAVGKAVWALAKSTAKIPYALGLDVSVCIKNRKSEKPDEN
jgi:hypothetical protein